MGDVRPGTALPALAKTGGAAAVAFALVAACAAAATREVALRQPPFWSRDSTLVGANVGLVLIVVLQAVRGMQHRRRKFKVVREAADQAPVPGPAPRPPAAAPSHQVVRCVGCAQPLKLAPAPRPLRFRCPKCQAVGVAP